MLPLNLCQLFTIKSDHIISYIRKNNQSISINQSSIKVSTTYKGQKHFKISTTNCNLQPSEQESQSKIDLSISNPFPKFVPLFLHNTNIYMIVLLRTHIYTQLFLIGPAYTFSPPPESITTVHVHCYYTRGTISSISNMKIKNNHGNHHQDKHLLLPMRLHFTDSEDLIIILCFHEVNYLPPLMQSLLEIFI